MTARLSPDHLGLPPPAHQDLIDGDRLVGWCRDGAIGFRGFADETEAAHAAWLAHRTLTRRLAHRTGARPIPIDVEPLALERRDDRERILAAGRPIATLVRPGPGSLAGDDAFGFELEIPGDPAELHLRAHAHHVYRTLRKSGVRWAMWRPTGIPAAAPSPGDDAQPDPVIDHQGANDVSQRGSHRRWWILSLPWGRARRVGRGTHRGAGRIPDGR